MPAEINQLIVISWVAERIPQNKKKLPKSLWLSKDYFNLFKKSYSVFHFEFFIWYHTWSWKHSKHEPVHACILSRWKKWLSWEFVYTNLSTNLEESFIICTIHTKTLQLTKREEEPCPGLSLSREISHLVWSMPAGWRFRRSCEGCESKL